MKPLRIAFYGKGGIGKSTIASNISALFSQKGKKVLHIGCDPKSDSTRILMSGKIPTVLEQLENKEILCRKDIIFQSASGVYCVEAGGPEAGSGCAGLGITTAMEELSRTGIFEEPWDIIVYDVLGDVVCGGFSVPMRQHFVDKVFIISSSGFMSLYAANNIFKGIRRYSREDNSLFGGMILNHIKTDSDIKIVNSFMQKTNTRALTWLEESPHIQFADFKKKLFVQEFPDSANTIRLKNTVEQIENLKNCPCPVPMNSVEMELFGDQMSRELYSHAKL
ncbi:MAG: nitrogenase iron protein NifH [Lachnospiraceae bacterium]|nr:nitrogenase iron protein NifH [Lachnospiraceae bacterium]